MKKILVLLILLISISYEIVYATDDMLKSETNLKTLKVSIGNLQPRFFKRYFRI